MSMPTFLADGFSEGMGRLIWIAIVLIALAVKKIVDKVREAKERERQQQQAPQSPRQAQRQPRRPVEPQAQSVEEIVRTMRQARRPQPGGTPPPPRQGQPVPKARVAQQRPRLRRQELANRHVIPAATGQGVEAETASLEKHLRRERAQTQERVAGQPVGSLASAAERAAAGGPRAILEIGLDDPDEARRGILYAEILGPPIALRKQQGMWDV